MERNIALDYLKVVLSILVITMHTGINSTGLFGWSISESLARIAVPCFFIMNGFFVDRIINDVKKIRSYLTTLVIIYLTWSFIYLPQYMAGDIETIINILLNGYSHLWYIVALAISIVILYGLRKVNSKVLLGLAFLGFIFGYLYQRPFLLGLDIDLPKNILFRVVGLGFPFLSIGYYLHKHPLKLTLKNSLILLIGFSIAFYGESLLTYNWLKENNSTSNYEIYFFMIFVCPLVIYTVSKIKIQSTDSGNSLSKIASGVYFIHLWIIIICGRIFADYSEFRKLPVIIIISLIFSAGIYTLNKRIKIFL